MPSPLNNNSHILDSQNSSQNSQDSHTAHILQDLHTTQTNLQFLKSEIILPIPPKAPIAVALWI